MDKKKINEEVEKNFEKLRTPDDLIGWVDWILTEAHDLTGTEAHSALKKIREEALVISKFLEHHKANFKEVTLNSGNENFDAKFEGKSGRGFFEVTCAKDGRLDYAVAVHSDKFDFAPVSGITSQSLLDAANGKTVPKPDYTTMEFGEELKELAYEGPGVAPQVEYVESRVEEIAKIVNERIKDKLSKSYNTNTILLVDIDTGGLVTDGNWKEMISFIDAHVGQKMFSEIYLLGSEKQQFEKIS